MKINSISNFLILTSVFTIITLTVVVACPKPETISPCICDSDVILCGGTQNINLNNIFESLSQELSEGKKHFRKFYLNNTAITELRENTFFDLTFDEIVINETKKLTLIDSNAFTATNLVTKSITISAPIINSTPNNDIFHVLSLMNNLEFVALIYTNINEIPSYAFKPLNGFQDKLYAVQIFSSDTLRKINSHAFYNLNSIRSLILGWTHIDFIPSNTFSIRKKSNQVLTINLDNLLLNGSSFGSNALSNIGRPAHINLDLKRTDGQQISFLDEYVFSAFFNENPENRINMNNQLFDCDDCRSYWLKKNRNFVEKVDYLKCKNGNLFSDNSNFMKCTVRKFKY